MILILSSCVTVFASSLRLALALVECARAHRVFVCYAECCECDGCVHSRGYYVEPTILQSTDPHEKLMTEVSALPAHTASRGTDSQIGVCWGKF